MPPLPAYRPDPALLSLADLLADPVAPAPFPDLRLRFRNDRAAAGVGLDPLDETTWVECFGRFVPLPDNLPVPLALRYHGHQFRVYNPDLGDGRGFTYAQLRDRTGRLLDLGTKGSGTTPWSRFGDGRLTLKGAVRELLATEMLEALGVRSSRTFSIVETGETLHRNDEPSPTRAAVLVRLSHGHIRIGSFQRLAFIGDAEGLARLVDYTLRYLFDEEPGPDAPLRLLDRVVTATAHLAASYLAAGFVHGVLNSDNINVTGESFDYGPWRFAPRWEPGFVAAYFDAQGLYAFGRQPQAIHWNVVQLALALAKLVDVEALAPILDRFPADYERAYARAMLARLGVHPRSDDLAGANGQADLAAVAALEAALGSGAATIDRFFFDWRGGRRTAAALPTTDAPALALALAGHAASADRTHAYWTDAEPCSLPIEEVERIWAAIADADDWAPLHAKVAAMRRMGAAHHPLA